MKVPQHKYKVLKLHGNGGIHLSRPRRLDGWLGSKCLDKNGKEIFEGDHIKVDRFVGVSDVTFKHGCFWAFDFPFSEFAADEIEIVEHVTE